MKMDEASVPIDDELLVSTITTNLFGPIRMTGALIEHLKAQESSTIINVSSGLGFVPMASAAVYSSTKAALHSFTLSLRYKLKASSVKVLEIIPPWVQTDLLNSKNESRAMPLADFISHTIKGLESEALEITPGQAVKLRGNAGPDEASFVNQFNDYLSQP